MKLLIMTQAIDLDHAVMGFFHRWIAEFARCTKGVVAIGQHVGRTDLPANVQVLSLGKERSRARMLQIVTFWWYVWHERRSYDAVFVHMTPIWVLLGWPLWVLLRKRVFLWYAAPGGGWKLRFAVRLVQGTFTSTPRGMPIACHRLHVVGQGIDLDRYRPSAAVVRERLVVSVGRVTPVKRYDVILRAFATLPADLRLWLVGAPVTPKDHAELKMVHALAQELGVQDRLQIQPLPPEQVTALLQRSQLFLHAAEGALDKALLEAMACRCLVTSSCPSARGQLPPECTGEHAELGARASALLALRQAEQDRCRDRLEGIVREHHSVAGLIPKILGAMGH